jgi:hypothetical protein|nr:uncharacterized protein LOC107281619 [Oryza sativa Japonica Group]XP_025882629.1 uncharacterized protein LOC107281619 [Oryza sativa Japonica Group]XP_025882630.1 uncharacterized protein LOC107281619 [Oryza sativa Japonica Group]XP_025882631.1 uncharacterized protein LOC107281619 [Oryza sativa Japonica Group]
MHELDFPTTEQIVYLGNVVDQFILWHKNDIELGSTDGTDRPPRIPVSPSRPPVVASPRDSPIASPPRPEPPVASSPGPEPPVASPPGPEPPVASPRTEKDAEEQSVLAKQQSQLAIREMSSAQPSEPVQAKPTKLAAGEIEAVLDQPMPDQPEQSQPEQSQLEESKGADVPVMVRTHKHKAKSASKKIKGFKQTFDDYLNYINSPDVPHEFENGKPFIYDWQLRRWHDWYIRVSTMKGIDSFTVAVGENIFWSGPCLLQVHFSDMHSLYTNLIAIWCLLLLHLNVLIDHYTCMRSSFGHPLLAGGITWKLKR